MRGRPLSLSYGIALLSAALLVPIAPSASADDHFEVKSSLLHSKSGPTRTNKCYPGERVFFTVFVEGLKKDEDGKVSIAYQYEVRNARDELLATIATGSANESLGFENAAFPLRAHFNVPTKADRAYKLAFLITDNLSGVSERHSVDLEVQEPTSPYPSAIRFANDASGANPHSGRFVQAEDAYLFFNLSGVTHAEPDSSIECVLTFVTKDGREASSPIKLVVDLAKQPDDIAQLPITFRFPTNAVFEGHARLEIKSTTEKPQIVDIPVTIHEILGHSR